MFGRFDSARAHLPKTAEDDRMTTKKERAAAEAAAAADDKPTNSKRDESSDEGARDAERDAFKRDIEAREAEMRARSEAQAGDPQSKPATAEPRTDHIADAVARVKRCRIIEYTNGEGMTAPAIVTAVEHSDEATRFNLCMFDPVMGPRNYYCQDAAAALRMSSGEPETWNWPVRD